MSGKALFTLAVLLLAPAPTAWSHGLERHYGTPINGEPAPTSERRPGGSPGFTLLALEATSTALKRALDEGRPEEAAERAQRLPRLAEELARRLQQDGLVDLDGGAIVALSGAAERIDASLREADPETVHTELIELRRLIRSMQESLREKDPQ